MLDRPLTLLAASLFAASAAVAVALVVRAPAADAAPVPPPPSAAVQASPSHSGSPPSSSAPVRSGPLTMTLRAERSVLAPEADAVRAMVEVQADESAALLPPRPTALTIVVDVSGSMDGAKIEDARVGAARLVEGLGDDDLLSIVSFESEAHTVHAPVRLGDARSAAAAAVEQLQPLGGTCLSCGLDVAYALLSDAPATHDRRVVIFSDGQVNEGISAPEGLVAIVGRARDAHRIVSTTVGIGTGYDAPLLNLLAERGLGNHLFSPGPGAIARILDREIEALRGVVARAVVLELTPAAGVRIGVTAGEVAREADGRVRVELGSLAASERRRILLPLSIGPGPGRDLVVARLVAADGRGSTARLHVERSSDPEEVRGSLDFGAAGYFAALAASSARSDAMTVAAGGDLDAARARLTGALADLTAVHEQTGLEELQVEMDEVASNLEGLDHWTGEELKAMVNNTTACDLETRRGVRAEGRWNVADLLTEHAGY